MKNKAIKKIIDNLKKNLQVEECDDFIGDLFEQRAENIHRLIIHNKEYKQYVDQINELDEEIEKNFDNSLEIIRTIERRENIAGENGYICEKLMYKHGLLDGMLFILEGTKQIDITKFLKDNK